VRAATRASTFLWCCALAAQGSPLTGTEHTAHFAIHFRPGSRAEASVDRVQSVVEADLARILAELGLRDFPHTIDLWLYDDVAELQRVTGVPSGGHSTTLQSHVPHDNDQTRVHELVHVVAEQFPESDIPKTGTEARNLFFAEGLANAVLRFVDGVAVDAVAAFHRRRGDLPSMAEMHALGDFYGWLREHPSVGAYDVAGSWMRYLLDTYGADKVRRYYKGVPVRDAFGAELGAIEKGWHARLDALQLRPGTLALLQQRHARSAAEKNPTEAKLGPAILGPAAEWRAIGGDVVELDGVKNEGDWCIARLLPDDVGDAMVRCTATALPGCYGVQVQFGGRCQGMVLRGQGTFLYTDAGGVAHDGAVQLGERPVQLVFRRRGARVSIWIDGSLAAEADIAVPAAPLAVGCVGGKARFTDIALRRL
jgi:hypothetical protein